MKSTILFKDYPYDVTIIDESRVAVSHLAAETISIVNLSTEKIEKTLSTENNLYGISYINNYIIFCVPRAGLKRLNLTNETIDSVIDDKKVAINSYVVASKKKICYTCPDTSDGVVVLNSLYDVIFKLQDKTLLRFPCGVAIDRNKNVYMIGFESTNLLVITPDGKTHQLLGKDEGLDSPTAVHYNYHTKQLMVVVCTKGKIHTYSLK